MVLEKVRQLHETIPDLQLIAVEHPMPELARMIQEKQLDIAFMRLPCYASEALRRKILFDDPFVAVIPAVHTLAEVEKIQLIQLNHENVLMFPREVGFTCTTILKPHSAQPESISRDRMLRHS